MNKIAEWREFWVATLGLCLMAWAGTISAASWANPDLLLDADTLKGKIDDPSWVIVDCRGLEDYLKGHIPGAISFGKSCKKALRDTTSRAFRDASKYESLLGKVGISNDNHVVFYYDGMKTLTDATVGFWIMEYIGHDKTHVLNGGLDAWRKGGNRLDTTPAKRAEAKFKVNFVPSRYGETAEVIQVAKGEAKSQLIDSRTPDEHVGKDIRAVRGGTIPNTSINKSHLDTLHQVKNPKTGKMEAVAYFDPDAASNAFSSLDKNQRTLAFCQTGTRSTMTYLQMRLLGFKDPANWDESWIVYGSQVNNPVEGEQWYDFAGLNKQLKNLEKQIAELEKGGKKK